MENVLLTILFGFIMGYTFQRLKVTGGMMIGALVGSAVFNIVTSNGYLPYELKFISQVIAGAFIGCTINKEDLKNIKQMIGPIALAISMFLLLNITLGFIIYNVSDLDMPTAFMSAVPGGISDIPIIAMDFGADPAKVAAMQFARMVTGIAVFPSVIKLFGESEESGSSELTQNSQLKKKVIKQYDYKFVTLTFAVALIGGIIGKVIGMSGGVLIFAMVTTIILKFRVDETAIPPVSRKFAQLLSGCFIGSTMVWADVLELRTLIIPIIILLVGYFLNCFATGFMLHKFFGFHIQEGMLSVSPAGASDMALIAADMGVGSPRLAMIQMSRLVLVIALFPQVISVILSAFN